VGDFLFLKKDSIATKNTKGTKSTDKEFVFFCDFFCVLCAFCGNAFSPVKPARVICEESIDLAEAMA
jgi:hypothetical protein